MALSGLTDENLKLILFGGKGGVGKTTCASSTGIYLSRYFKTLLISTDPAHSLSDSLAQKIGDEAVDVKGITNLSAIEIDAKKTLSVFKGRYEKAIKQILDTSTYLDREDVEAVFALPIPGVDEVMGLKTIIDMIEEKKFGKFVVDTAPTGHALRLLTLPDTLDDWIKVMAKMRCKYRYVMETFSGRHRADDGDEFLVEMKKTVNRIRELFRNSAKCEFIIVTIPEEMAVSETERLCRDLNSYGIKVKQLVMNNVLVPDENCGFCMERRKGQEQHINYIEKEMSNIHKTIVPLQPREVRGIAPLERFKELLFG